MSYLLNSWYAGAWSSEVKFEALLPRTLLNEPIVFYRKPDGTPVALQDRCCHRFLPLSCGKQEGEALRCGYHGMLFNPQGKCIDIPGQAQIPQAAQVRSFPVVERYNMLWIWMGEPSLATPDSIEDFHWLDDPEWRWKGTVYNVKANYRLIVENLLDLNHLPYVHQSTIGNAAVIDAAVTYENGDNFSRVTRWMLNSAPPPSYVKAGVTVPVDRWQIIDYTLPSNVRLYTGGCPAGTGAPDEKRVGGVSFRNLNMITPETAGTSHYFWAQAHDFDIDNPATTDFVFSQFDEAFREDWAIFEKQQASINLTPDAPRMHLKGDQGQLHAMRVLDKAIAANSLAKQPSI